MKRDMDLIREMLRIMEESESAQAPSMTIEGYTKEQVGFHALLLIEAGLADGQRLATLGVGIEPAGRLFKITWEGYEFLANAKDDSVWEKAKAKAGDVSFSVLSVALQKLVIEKIGL